MEHTVYHAVANNELFHFSAATRVIICRRDIESIESS